LVNIPSTYKSHSLQEKINHAEIVDMKWHN
jgi:hypothetical protein